MSPQKFENTVLNEEYPNHKRVNINASRMYDYIGILLFMYLDRPKYLNGWGIAVSNSKLIVCPRKLTISYMGGNRTSIK